MTRLPLLELTTGDGISALEGATVKLVTGLDGRGDAEAEAGAEDGAEDGAGAVEGAVIKELDPNPIEEPID